MAEWDDSQDTVDALVAALTTFDWHGADDLCRRLVARLTATSEPFPARPARTVLRELRRKRQFALMALVGDALIESGLGEAEVRRQYAQALIDQGQLNTAELILRGVATDAATPPREWAEAMGLLGRVAKQRYVDARQPAQPRQQANLRSALEAYAEVYRKNPALHLWHGINVVALLLRAERDGVDVTGAPLNDGRALAREILARLAEMEEERGTLDYWDRATSLEAHVALGDTDAALADLREYMRDRDTDAFECASTLRQLREVWQVEDTGEAGGGLLVNGLQAALLRRSGGEVTLQSADVHRGLQLNFGAVGDLTLDWWRNGLARCEAVARIEDFSGRRVGTGVLVRRRDFLDGPDDHVLLTNWHVISDKGEHPLSIRPAVARANFEACGKTYRISGQMVAYSRALDASLVAFEDLDGTPAPCPVEPPAAAFDAAKQPRVYVIGYPGGRGLSFSVHDSIWLDTDGTKLHYRTPTEPGSSGSPVFDQDNWTLVGLHHAGRTDMPKLGGKPGTYEANEGISVDAIRASVRQNPRS